MRELGLLDEFLKLPHQKAATLSAFFGEQEYASRISPTCRPAASSSR